jgi:hypothetical protein
MKTAMKLLSLLYAILLMTSLPILAQTSSSFSGGLSGAVTDTTGALVSGATVTLVGPQGAQTLTTDSAGRFTASGLTPGFYDVTVEKPGFKKVSAKHSEVVVNSNSTLNLTLPLGNVDTIVEVTSTAAGIDTQQTAVTSNLTDSFYNSVPMPRNVSAIFYAAPGVEQGQVAGNAGQTGPGSSNPSIGGASALENLYVVDGVTITDQAFGSIGTFNRNHGSLGTGINLSFIKEVDVKTTGFEPQYGKATGGIVQIVTKSGGDQFHGAIGAYLGPGKFYASRYQFYQFGYQLVTPSQTLNSPQYDVSAELGGYLPGFRERVFFFGAFDPSLKQDIVLANPKNALTYAHGPYQYNTTTLSWSGKLTFKLSSATTFEASSFGDPSKHNVVPGNVSPGYLATNFPQSISTSYRFGSIDSIARVRSAITSSLVGDASYAYNQNHFNETLLQNQYQVIDQSPNVFGGGTVTTGVGAYEPSTNNTYSIAGNLSKTVNFLGQHTLSVGYAYDHTNFLDQFPLRSGAYYPIPAQNANGQTLTTLFPSIPAAANGAMTNAIFRVFAANTDPTLTTGDTTCNRCPYNLAHQKVYASVYRGTYSNPRIPAIGRYKTAYGNDDYQMNRFVSLNLGVRWEQEQIGGTLLKYTFTGSWSPRLGINIDPVGDHKGKIFFNYGRNYWAMPLDAAIRQLGNEQDDTAYVFAPVVNADGSYTVIPDSAHNLNGLPKSTSSTGVVSNFGKPSFASSTGEGIIAGTKGEYEDEYVIGIEREIKNGLVVKARYTDRRLGRIIEDIGTQSPEGSTIIGGFNGGIANPGPSTDIGVNEQEITYTQTQFLAANPSGNPSSTTYKAPVAGCTATNDTFFAVGGPFINGLNQPVGGACFTNIATADAPCSSVFPASQCSGPGGIGDGKPDGFVKPVRRYQAAEFEVDKRFSNHWLAQINYRWGTLYGNYEGAYRNDNGQSDPGISSLFDFTAGNLGLLTSQFANGDLSSDRRNVGNLFVSYTVGSDTPILAKAKGLQLGAGWRGQSGVPLSLLGDHPIYLNQGEVPVGGRGAAGRTPATMQLDLHTEYSVPVKEKYTVKLGMDMFNVTNSQFELSRVQYTQTTGAGIGIPPSLNTDYGRPTGFQGPFYARAQVRIEF